MKKIFEILIFLLLLSLAMLAMSCGGTRKTDTQIKDSIHIENNYSQGTKIVLGNTFTYKPFDALKPMKIDNVVYKNVIVTNDKSKTITKWNDRFITKTIVTEKNKATDKTNYIWLWIGLAFIVLLFAFLWFYLPKLKTGIHL